MSGYAESRSTPPARRDARREQGVGFLTRWVKSPHPLEGVPLETRFETCNASFQDALEG